MKYKGNSIGRNVPLSIPPPPPGPKFLISCSFGESYDTGENEEQQGNDNPDETEKGALVRKEEEGPASQSYTRDAEIAGLLKSWLHDQAPAP